MVLLLSVITCLLLICACIYAAITRAQWGIGVYVVLCLAFMRKRVFYLIGAFKNAPAITVSDTSIYDHQTGQTFLWDDIDYYTLREPLLYYSRIEIFMTDREKRIEMINDPLKRSFVRFYCITLKNPDHTITLSVVDMANGKVLQLLQQHDLASQQAI